MELRAGQLKLGIEVGSELVIHVKLSELGVAEVGVTGLHARLDTRQITNGYLPLELGDIAGSLQLVQGTLEPQRVFADFVARKVGLFVREHGVGVGLGSVGLLYRIEEGKLDIQPGREIVDGVLQEVLIVVIEARKVGILLCQVGEGQSHLVLTFRAHCGSFGFLLGKLDGRAIGGGTSG